MNASKSNRWLQLFVIALGAAVIYQLPYLRYSYYDAMMEAFKLNNAQLGNLMSLFGFCMILFYFPGGWLSDNFSNRKILSIGQILTGGAGLYFATFPPYPIALCISVFWAASTAMVFWTALIRIARSLGSEKEQGRIFGLLEGGRGLFATLIGLAIVPVFTHLGSGVTGLRTVILIYAFVGIGCGILSWFILDDDGVEKEEQIDEKPSGLSDFLTVIRMPAVWLTAIVFFTTMNLFICLGYLTPYLSNVMGASVGLAATIGIVRTWGLQMLGGPGGGFLADKISTSKTLIISYALITVGFVLLYFVPADPSFLILAIIAMMVFGFMIYLNRGIYWATLSESKVPMSLTGAATAFITAFGGSPDAFLYTLIGNWLDKYPGGLGYKYIFLYAAACALVGFIASILLMKKIHAQQSMKKETVSTGSQISHEPMTQN